MKTKYFVLMAVLLGTTGSVSLPAQEQIFFDVRGSLVESSCSPDVEFHFPGNIIALPKVRVSDLNATGKTAGETIISFVATNCSFYFGNLWIHFSAADTDSNGRIRATGNSNVRFEIHDMLVPPWVQSRIDLNTPLTGTEPGPGQGSGYYIAGQTGVDISRISGTKRYMVRYYAHAPVTHGGKVSAQVTATFVYD